MKQTSIIIGLGFGDEGKGLTTAYLASKQHNPLVIRFSGGQQAGHTVVSGDIRHVFSNFGSGTLHGVPTYWSKYCTWYPTGLMNEYKSLKKSGYIPKIYIDNLSMITTPYDIAFNRTRESILKHGSCGLGFAATIERSEKKIYSLYAQDLLLPEMHIKGKLRNIATYYTKKVSDLSKEKDSKAIEYYEKHLKEVHVSEFVKQLYKSKQLITLTDENILHSFDSLIFEGSQGVLLDMDYGFFPHVTRSNTVSKNAIEIITKLQLPDPEMYYISRAYQSRHGNGPMTNQHLPLKLQNNENETNVTNPWQGKLRSAPLDLNLLEYALTCDKNYVGNVKKHLVMTCLDQIVNLTATKNGKSITLQSTKDLVDNHLTSKFDTYFESHSAMSSKLLQYNA